MPVGIVERLAGSGHREDDEIIDLALVLRLHPLVGIEGAIGAVAARHDAGDLARQIRDVERFDPARAALTVEDPLPGRLDATTEWRDHAEARDDNSPHASSSSPSPETSSPAACNKKPVERITMARPALSHPHRASALCVLFEKFGGVTDGQNRLRGIVRNLTTEFFFKCHHELDGVETVSAEIVDEACVVDHFLGLNTKVFDHDLLYPLANLTHRSPRACFLDPTPG